MCLKSAPVTYADLIEHYGSQAEAARRLNLSAPTIWAWQHDTIPYDRQCQIQVESRGRLKAERKHDARLGMAA